MLSETPGQQHPLYALNQGGRGGAGGAPGSGGRPGGNGGGAAPGGVVGILHVIGGNDRGKAHPLNRPLTTIGRGADQDCFLADIAVSRRHITISVEGPRYRMKDLGSGNGSLLNGVRTDTAILNDGDQIEIGNTLLRLEHAPSRAQAQAQPMAAGGVPRADSGASTMMADAGMYPQVQQARPQQMPAPQPVAFPPAQAPIADPFAPQEQASATPSDAIAMPPAARPISSSLPSPVNTGTHASPGLLDTPVKKAAVFGTIGLIVLLVGALVVKKAFFDSTAQAQKLYTAGVKAYGEGEYDQARKLFSEAHDLVPDSPKTADYIRNCDMEITARKALKLAKGYSDAKKWDDALAQLDKIDQASAAYEDAAKLKKTIVPGAVAQDIADAKDAMEGDNDLQAAMDKLEAALTLDPDNAEAQELAKKLRATGKVTSRPPKEKVAKASHTSTRKEPRDTSAKVAVKDTPKDKGSKSKGGDDDDDLAPVSTGGGASGDVLASKAAGPYKAKDFAGAAQALRLQAKNEKGKAFDKDTALATQIVNLGAVYNKAESEKGGNPSAAVNDYQQAMAIDGRIGKGTHAAYFKGQIGKLAKQAAQTAFSKGSYDVAFEQSKNAQRYGGDDGGIGKQLSAKAAEFNSKASAMQKSNLNGAKTLWRQVVRMVPASDPNYIKAYQSLNTATASHKDDDEE